ncbi:MAG: spermidine synthase [Thermoguttaceae bacterium]
MKVAAAVVGSTLLVGATVVMVVQTPADEVLYRTQSEFNTIIVSEDSQGVRTLRFEEYGARQSVVKPGDADYIALPYAKVVHAGLAVPENPKRVLIVGLGGGTIPQFLHRHFPDLVIDVVELDPAVVRVATTYFGFKPDDRMRVFTGDGRKFIEKSDPVYDVIYLDAFSADSVPYSLSTAEFLGAVRKALTGEGVVVGNVWSSSSNDLYESMVRTYQQVFAEVAINEVRGVGNRIVIASPRAGELAKERIVERAGKLAAQARFPYDLRAIVEDGYNRLLEPNGAGQVLRDR